MQTFSSEVHTREALAGELDGIFSTKPDAVLAGSLGRAAALSAICGDGLSVFDNRNILTRPDGSVRDIDIINFPAEVARETGPYKVDTEGYKSDLVTIDYENGAWVLRSPYKKFEAGLHPAVMEPIESEICGAKVITLPLQTQLNLMGLRGLMREKDQANLQRFQQAIDQKGSRRLPEQLYAPFDDLREVWQEDCVIKLRQHYRSLMPASVRRRLTPLHKLAVKKLLIKRI